MKNKKALTLIELIIASSLVGVIILAAFSMDRVSRTYYISSGRKAEVTNEANFVMEHIAKSMSNAVRSGANPGFVVDNTTAGDPILEIYLPDLSTPSLADSRMITYGNADHDGGNKLHISAPFSPPELLSSRITQFQISNATNANLDIVGVTVSIAILYDPSAGGVDANDNPEVKMTSTFYPEQSSM